MRDTVFRDFLSALAAALAAVALYSLAGSAGRDLLVVFDAFAVIVLVFSVRRGEVFGAVLGTVCGLVQDTFTLGPFGVAGLTKTLLGFWAGFVARRIDIAPFTRNALFTLALSVLEVLLWALVTAVVRTGSVSLHGGLFLLRPVVTAVLVSAFFVLERRVRERRDRGD